MAHRFSLLTSLTLAALACLSGCAGRPSNNQWNVPTITVQPQDQSVMEGQSATFTADCHTEFFITEVQWLVNGQNKALYYGQTSYTTPPTILANDGDRIQYVVYNAYGSASSRVALLHVAPAQIQAKGPELNAGAAAGRILANPCSDPR